MSADPFSAEALIETFGNQAYHKGALMVVECVNNGDLETAAVLTQSCIELLGRGYHKLPLPTSH